MPKPLFPAPVNALLAEAVLEVSQLLTTKLWLCLKVCAAVVMVSEWSNCFFPGALAARPVVAK